MSTLTLVIITVFVVGYICIATESLLRINKAAIALLMCVFCWTLLMMAPGSFYPNAALSAISARSLSTISATLPERSSSSWEP